MRCKMNIIKISKIDNVNVENIHNGYLFPSQSIIEVEFEDGSKRTLDLIANRDITDIDYFLVKKSYKSNEKIIFQQNSD